MKRVAIYSGTGGAGKSFIAVNLASSLFQEGVRVALCELTPHNLLTLHFGGSLVGNDLNEAEKGGVIGGIGASHLHEEQLFHTHRLHADFTLLTARSIPEQNFEAGLKAALQYADRKSGADGVMILDIPTNMQPGRNETLFDLELEVVAAEPASVVHAFRRRHGATEQPGGTAAAQPAYVVINKKDLRSDLSRDAAVMAESFFGNSVLASIHFDSAVPEAFAHKSLLHDYAPHSQAAMDMGELSRSVGNVLKLGKSEEKDLA